MDYDIYLLIFKKKGVWRAPDHWTPRNFPDTTDPWIFIGLISHLC